MYRTGESLHDQIETVTKQIEEEFRIRSRWDRIQRQEEPWFKALKERLTRLAPDRLKSDPAHPTPLNPDIVERWHPVDREQTGELHTTLGAYHYALEERLGALEDSKPLSSTDDGRTRQTAFGAQYGDADTAPGPVEEYGELQAAQEAIGDFLTYLDIFTPPGVTLGRTRRRHSRKIPGMKQELQEAVDTAETHLSIGDESGTIYNTLQNVSDSDISEYIENEVLPEEQPPTTSTGRRAARRSSSTPAPVPPPLF